MRADELADAFKVIWVFNVALANAVALAPLHINVNFVVRLLRVSKFRPGQPKRVDTLYYEAANKMLSLAAS